jgi:hypothetical protein
MANSRLWFLLCIHPSLSIVNILQRWRGWTLLLSLLKYNSHPIISWILVVSIHAQTSSLICFNILHSRFDEPPTLACGMSKWWFTPLHSKQRCCSIQVEYLQFNLDDSFSLKSNTQLFMSSCPYLLFILLLPTIQLRDNHSHKANCHNWTPVFTW